MVRVFLLLFLFSFSASAQGVYRAYYDKSNLSTDSASSYWYSELSNATHQFFSYYTATRKIRSKELRDTLGTQKFYYHPNEALKAEIVWDKAGSLKSKKMFYPDGKRQAELALEERVPGATARLRLHILNYWDSLGNQIVTDGNGTCACVLDPEEGKPFVESGKVANKMKEGTWSGMDGEKRTFEEHYSEGNLVDGVLNDSDGKVYTYTEVSRAAQPPGGLQSFYRYIGNNLKYPANARKLGIEGKVFIEFVIQKDGTMADVRVLRGISAECDAEALRVIRESRTWDPGLERGKIVRSRYVLPIGFKLQ